LPPEEEAEFKKWARENYTPYTPIPGIWHPVVQDECVKMNREAKLNPSDIFGEGLEGWR
jgi:hypothetical protein